MKHFFAMVFLLLPLAGCSPQSSESALESNEDSQMDSSDLADITFQRILKKHGNDLDPVKLPKAQQTVLLVYHAQGILGNGGFQYLFEGDIPGDPEYLLTRQAYKTIGAQGASAAFEKAFAVFPKSTPPSDAERRLRMWQSKYDLVSSLKNDASPDSMYFAAMDDVMEKLIAYITANQAEFASLPK